MRGAEAAQISLVPAERSRCLAILRSALTADAFWPAMHAAEGLTDAGESALVRSDLSRRLASENDDQRRCGLARELARAGDRSKAAILFEILAKPAAYGHTHAAESLYKIAEVGDGDALRAVLADDKDVACQLMAAAALARCGSEQALALIRRRLVAPGRDSRKLAAWIVGRLGDARDIPALRSNRRGETDEEARAFAEHALAALGDRAGADALRANLKSPRPEIRAMAAECVARAHLTETAAELRTLLDGGEIDVRVRAAHALLALSQPHADSNSFSVDVYSATKAHPRYSEGSVIALDDGRILYATTEFNDSADDFAKAQIVARTSNDGGLSWGPARVLQRNVGGKNVMSATLRRLPSTVRGPAPIGLFYLVKNDVNDLHVWLRVSNDEARTFDEPHRVTDGRGYHVMNNDRVTVLRNGRILCPVSWSADVRAVNHFVSLCFLSDDGGKSWRRGRGEVDQPKRGAMEPEVIPLRDGRVLMIVRTQLGFIAASVSADGGDTWSRPASWNVVSPEAPATVRRVPATDDLMLVWNPDFTAGSGHGGARTPLAMALSSDEGKTWKRLPDLESRPDEAYAYTSLLFDRDRALMTYYVQARKTGRISSRFRSISLRRLTESP